MLAFFIRLLTVFSVSRKSFLSSPGNATNRLSVPGFISFILFWTALLILLFILFLTTACLETFWETMNPNRLLSKSLFAVLKIKKPSLKRRPCLKTFLISSVFLSRLFKGSIFLNAQFPSLLRPPPGQDIPPPLGFGPCPKTVSPASFPCFFMVCNRHVINLIISFVIFQWSLFFSAGSQLFPRISTN